jgi:hypothetical protein
MAVAHDDRRGICQKRGLEDLAWVHSDGVELTSAHLVIGDKAMLRREAQDGEHLGSLVLKQRHQRLNAIGRRDNLPPDEYRLPVSVLLRLILHRQFSKPYRVRLHSRASVCVWRGSFTA